MTEIELFEKIEELLKTNDEYVMKVINSIVKNKHIDLNTWENDYLLPKILLSEILKNAIFKWEPDASFKNSKIRDTKCTIRAFLYKLI